jgi:hypothetical protein
MEAYTLNGDMQRALTTGTFVFLYFQIIKHILGYCLSF